MKTKPVQVQLYPIAAKEFLQNEGVSLVLANKDAQMRSAGLLFNVLLHENNTGATLTLKSDGSFQFYHYSCLEADTGETE